MNPALANAILQKLGFRGESMRRYQAAAIYTAIAQWPAEIGADDVPEQFRPQDATTAGCCWALLKSDGTHLFSRAGRRMSRTESRNSAWINTYRLNSVDLANAWLAANGWPPAQPIRQPELQLLGRE
jgi:hypothetical protein